MSIQRQLVIYDGTGLIGTVAGAGRRWLAFDARGNRLPGEYRSERDAVAAIDAALSGSCRNAADHRDRAG